MRDGWSGLGLRDFAGPPFGPDPRGALMWLPRAADVAAVAAVARAVGGRVVDVGAGSGLLAALLSQEPGVEVRAIDPGDDGRATRRIGRFFGVEPVSARALGVEFDCAVVSWMEAGCDYREDVSRLASVVVQAVDTDGGCGILGETGYEPFGFALAHAWTGPSWEDAAHALRTRGRGVHGASLPRGKAPGNRVEVWAKGGGGREALRTAALHSRAGPAFPWESELDALAARP